MAQAELHFDVLIVGGGMVGATLACLIAENTALKIAVVEAAPLLSDAQTVTPFSPSYDSRSTALARGTIQIFEQLGLWQEISQRAEPIHKIHVSELGRFGFTSIDREQEGVTELGCVVENAWLGRVLCRQLLKYPSIQLFSPASLQSLHWNSDQVHWNAELGIAAKQNSLDEQKVQSIKPKQSISATLLVAADGVNSTCCRLLNIDHQVENYQQAAIVANITPLRGHQQIAYERFTPAGPMALLPLTDNRMALVLTINEAELEHTLQLSDEAFLALVDERIGGRLKGFSKVGQRAHYPLRLVRVSEQVRPQCVVVGNAAHALHPIAGQGFNLSARDVVMLAYKIKQADDKNEFIASAELLNEYAESRQVDQQATIQFSDKLMRIFNSTLPGLPLARNLGMLAMDLWPQGKQLLSRQAMGLSAGVPLSE